MNNNVSLLSRNKQQCIGLSRNKQRCIGLSRNEQQRIAAVKKWTVPLFTYSSLMMIISTPQMFNFWCQRINVCMCVFTSGLISISWYISSRKLFSSKCGNYHLLDWSLSADTSVPESFSPASVVIIIFWTDLYSKSCSHHALLSVANKGHNYANGMLLQYKTCK